MRPLAWLSIVLLWTTACTAASEPAPSITPQDPLMIEKGEALYKANCAECHGADLRGTDVGPSHLSVVYEPGHHGDAAFMLAVQRGVRAHHWPFGDMAPIPGLDIDQIEAIVAYVREQQRLHGFEPYPP